MGSDQVQGLLEEIRPRYFLVKVHFTARVISGEGRGGRGVCLGRCLGVS